MIKMAMINVGDKIKSEGMKSKMILQVHDELVFEVPEDEVEDMSRLVKENMENALQLNVPVVVEIGTGHNWLEAH
jgi:DNA polymerase-1